MQSISVSRSRARRFIHHAGGDSARRLGGVTIARTKVRRDIDRGAVVLVGIGADDDDEDIDYVVRKFFNLPLGKRQ